MRRLLLSLAVGLAVLACGKPPGTSGTGGGAAGGTAGASAAGGSAAGGSAAGGSAAGGSTAGGSAAGGSTAGGSSAGGSTAGGSTAGGSTAGGSTAGGSTAGGSTAGGSTAGGSTAGGSAAGGSAAGGSTAGGETGGGTADAGTPQIVRFIATGDTGKGNAGQFAVGAAMGTFCTTHVCDFVVLLGDNFYPSGVTGVTDAQWNTAFVQPYAPVNAPFYAVLGNHDYGGEGLGTDILKGRHEVDYSQVNPKWHMPASAYHFRSNHVEFFAADTNRSMFSIDSDVRSDFATWFAASTATWKIAWGHHPYKSNGEHGNAGDYDRLPIKIPIVDGASVKSFIESSVCGRADLYMSGHDHHLEFTQATCTSPGSPITTQFLISGAGSSPTSTPGNDPTWFKSAQLGFAYVEIVDRSLTVTFYSDTGAQLFSRTITK